MLSHGSFNINFNKTILYPCDIQQFCMLYFYPYHSALIGKLSVWSLITLCSVFFFFSPLCCSKRDHRQRHVSGPRGSWILEHARSLVAAGLRVPASSGLEIRRPTTQRFHPHTSFQTRPDPARDDLLMLTVSHSANHASHH